MASTFVPRRDLAILPSDAVPGSPYDLARPDLCQSCTEAVIELSSYEVVKTSSVFDRTFKWAWLGAIRDLQRRDYCKLCSLVTRAIRELCPPYAKSNTHNETERIRLSIDTAADGRDVAISSSRYLIANLRDVEDLKRELHPPSEQGLPGKQFYCSCCSLPPRLCNSVSQINFEMLQTWLQECSCHSECNGRSAQDIPDKDGYPSLLVDVKNRNLVFNDGPARYCSLSYVYGNTNIFKTTRETVSLLQRLGGLDDPNLRLPSTIKDAIVLAGKLNEQYLWIDSLCIVHDDGDQIQRAISTMGQIYQNSVLTIVAASETIADDHIPGVLPGSRLAIPRVNIGGKELYVSPTQLHLQLLGSKYASRAWTYQEQILSTRTLYITSSLSYYHCLEDGRSEFGYSERMGDEVNPMYQLLTEGVKSGSTEDQWMGKPYERSKWTHYFELVRDYSRKELTYSSDVLAAFTGILVTLEPVYQTTFLAGLPLSALLEAMHWITGREGGSLEKHPSTRRTGFPTWSWLGLVGPIEWLEDVCLPTWWEWQGMMLPEPVAAPAAGFDACVRLRCRSQIAFTKGLSTELTSLIAYPAKLLDPGQGLPINLIKILDSEGRWCGRICADSLDTIANSEFGTLALMLLSSCTTLGVLMREEPSPELPEREVVFDASYFPIEAEDASVGRLYNLLLIQYKGSGYVERRGICQIYSDVWESLEKTQEDVLLI